MATPASLPLKYRPQTFETLVGQETIARYLSALIKRGQLGRNIILSGEYGSGKSSSCRIYARALNCLNPTPAGSPCNECEHCQLFFQDQFPDYLEIDGASRGRIEQIKELVDIARTPPMYGRKRVINIDEAQGVSRQGFDALLKLIEEPPPYLVFIFTTTELNKIREAIRSRCQKLEVKLLDHGTAVGHLEHVCKAEQFTYERSALELIAFLSHGHPRDLLTNLEQTSYLGDITLDNVKALFNLGFVKHLHGFYNALFNDRHTDAVSELRTWGDTPTAMLDLIREYALYLQYTFVFNTTLTLNPIFGFIPRGDLTELMNALRRQANAAGVSFDAALSALIQALAKATASSPIALELLTIDLYNLIYRFKFNAVQFGQPAVEAPTVRTAKRSATTGRQFAGAYRAAITPQGTPTVVPNTPASAITPVAQTPVEPVAHVAPSIAPETLQPAPPEAPPAPALTTTSSKLFPHHLLNFGFDPKPLTELSMTFTGDHDRR